MSEKKEPALQPDMELDRAKDLVARILDFITSDGSRLTRFLQLTGFQTETLRESGQSLLFMLSVLDSIAKDELLLHSLEEHEQITPEMIEMTRARLAFQISVDVTRPGRSEQEAAAVRAKVQQQLQAILRRSKGG